MCVNIVHVCIQMKHGRHTEKTRIFALLAFETKEESQQSNMKAIELHTGYHTAGSNDKETQFLWTHLQDG